MKNLLLLFFLAGAFVYAGDGREDVIIPIGGEADEDPRAGMIHSPFVASKEQDKQHWDRLLFLSSIKANSVVNPFNAEQDNMFQIQLSKQRKKKYWIYGSIGVAILANACGYFGFFGILDPSLMHTLIPALLPTMVILSESIAIFGVGHEATNVYDGLTLTLHEQVLEELNFLAQFLVRKSFSQDPQDILNVQQVVQNMDLSAIRNAYALQGNAQPDEVSSLTRFLDEALIYLKEGRIVDEAFEVGEEIRLCLLEQQYAQILELLKAQQPFLIQ